MLGRGRRTCETRQNASANGQSRVRCRTHQMAPQSVHMTREAKRPYQAVSTTSRNTLGPSVVSAPMKRTHHVEMPPQETPEAS